MKFNNIARHVAMWGLAASTILGTGCSPDEEGLDPVGKDPKKEEPVDPVDPGNGGEDAVMEHEKTVQNYYISETGFVGKGATDKIISGHNQQWTFENLNAYFQQSGKTMMVYFAGKQQTNEEVRVCNPYDDKSSIFLAGYLCDEAEANASIRVTQSFEIPPYSPDGYGDRFGRSLKQLEKGSLTVHINGLKNSKGQDIEEINFKVNAGAFDENRSLNVLQYIEDGSTAQDNEKLEIFEDLYNNTTDVIYLKLQEGRLDGNDLISSLREGSAFNL